MRIDTKLAWKLTRIVELHDPYSAGLYVPGSTGMKILVNAARASGVSEPVLIHLDDAYKSFEHLRKQHAGDRRTLDMLFAGLAEEEQDRRDIEQRKAAFHANTSLWGVRASMRLMSFVVHTSKTNPDAIDVAHIAGLFGVSRTRPDVPWRVAQLQSEDSEGGPSSVRTSAPIDPATPRDGPPVLRAHSSDNVPELLALDQGGGRTEYRLGAGPIGKMSTFDLVFAEFMPEAGGRYRTEQDRQLSVSSRNRTPAEKLILELVIHRDVYGPIDPIPELVSELWGNRSASLRDDPEMLPLCERIQQLGPGMSAFRHRHVPRHGELMKRIFDSRGWDPEAFSTYRIDMAFPPAPTALRMVIPLPEKPKA